MEIAVDVADDERDVGIVEDPEGPREEEEAKRETVETRGEAQEPEVVEVER